MEEVQEMGPLKLGRSEQVEGCMNTQVREQEEPGDSGRPLLSDVTRHQSLRPNGQVCWTEPQSHSCLCLGTIPTVEEVGDQAWEA